MKQEKDEELTKIVNASYNWVKNNLEFYRIGESTIEVETPLIDAFGQKIYCFIEKLDDGYRISDDGWLMYKLDPNQEDEDFYEAAVARFQGNAFRSGGRKLAGAYPGKPIDGGGQQDGRDVAQHFQQERGGLRLRHDVRRFMRRHVGDRRPV